MEPRQPGVDPGDVAPHGRAVEVLEDAMFGSERGRFGIVLARDLKGVALAVPLDDVDAGGGAEVDGVEQVVGFAFEERGDASA
jgi:hypothetical protein